MATTTTRKRRARKTTAKKTSLNTSTAKLPVSEVSNVPPRPEEEIADIVIETSDQPVVNVPPQTPIEPLKAFIKDYPRDGLSLILLPLLLLESFVKEVLKATNTIK